MEVITMQIWEETLLKLPQTEKPKLQFLSSQKKKKKISYHLYMHGPKSSKVLCVWYCSPSASITETKFQIRHRKLMTEPYWNCCENKTIIWGYHHAVWMILLTKRLRKCQCHGQPAWITALWLDRQSYMHLNLPNKPLKKDDVSPSSTHTHTLKKLNQLKKKQTFPSAGEWL